jgi:DNA-binding NarL/FixJ family response regulator
MDKKLKNHDRSVPIESSPGVTMNTNSKKIRVAIIEDELMMSGALTAWIARFHDLQLVGCAADGEAGWQLCQSEQPEIALIDIRLPKLDGLELTQRLAAKFPKMRLLAMSGLMDAYTVWRVMQSGVHGYVNKTQSPESLIEAIRAVARGNTFFGPVFTRVKEEWLSKPEAFQKILSVREQQILRGVAAGWEDDRIGDKLGISPGTVEAHRKNIRQKLGVHNDRSLLAYARHWGLDVQTTGPS